MTKQCELCWKILVIYNDGHKHCYKQKEEQHVSAIKREYPIWQLFEAKKPKQNVKNAINRLIIAALVWYWYLIVWVVGLETINQWDDTMITDWNTNEINLVKMNPVKPAKSKQSNNCQCVLTELIGRGSFFFFFWPLSTSLLCVRNSQWCILDVAATESLYNWRVVVIVQISWLSVSHTVWEEHLYRYNELLCLCKSTPGFRTLNLPLDCRRSATLDNYGGLFDEI